MKTLILSNYSDKISELNAVTEPNKKAYADKHGYQFENHKFDYAPEGHVAWIELIREKLSNFDYIMTIGCDAMFMNLGIEVEVQEGAALTLAREHITWWPINNDVMIWQKCPDAFMVLDRLMTDSPMWLEYPWLWQNHLWNLMQSNPMFDRAVDLRDAREMNSCLQSGQAKWQLGDWILHLLDIPNDQKVKLAKDYLRLSGDGCYYPLK